MSYASANPDNLNILGKKKLSPDMKKRVPKKRKKKGINEPQKPVSAYALFFRDTQAAIKAENSSATFGEISKIVASMWDSLSEEAKQVYKQKTETAKRDYLKHLAAFRANMISKGAIDVEEEDSQPLSVLRDKMAEQKASSSPMHGTSSSNNYMSPVIDLTETPDEILPPPPQLHPLAPNQPTFNMKVPAPCFTQQPQEINPSSIPSSAARPVSPAMVTKIIVPGHNGAQSTIHLLNSLPGSQNQCSVPQTTSHTPVKHIVLHPLTSSTGSQVSVVPTSTITATPSPPPPIQLRNIVSQSHNPITILPSKPGQIIKVVPAESGGVTFASVPSHSVKGRVIKMVNVVNSVHSPNAYPSPVTQTVRMDGNLGVDISSQQDRISPNIPEKQVQPILQLLEQESSGDLPSSSNSRDTKPHQVHIELPDSGPHIEEVDENALMRIPQQNLLQTTTTVVESGKESSVDNVLKCNPNNLENSSPRRCIREGCNNIAVSCPYWDNEYCSNECVYSHCRDVFDAWASARQVSTSV